MKKLVVSLAAFGAVLGICSLSRAQEPHAPGAPAGEREFGNPGVIAVGAGTELHFGYTSISPPQGSSSSVTSFGLRPQAAYFVIEGLSVGGEVLFDYSKAKDSDAETTFGIGPLVGYNVWVSPALLSVWPQAGVTYSSTSTSFTSQNGTGGTTSTSVTNSKFTVNAFVPLLIHPVHHFHFGIGPYFAADLSSSVSGGGQSTDGNKNLSLGLRGEIGGWL
jgi:hypothetical protein